MSAPREPTDRRDFLLKLGTGAGVAAITVQAGASLRSLVPNVSYDAPTTVKLGPPAEFPDGLKFLPDERVLVFREGNTFHAISAVCTHLGCTVRAEPLANPQTTDAAGAPLKLTHRFLCPCHGSQYQGRRHQRGWPGAEAARLVPAVDRAGRRADRDRSRGSGRPRFPPDAGVM